MARGERVLVTGGAGFVGSHLADALLASGHEVTLFDNLEPQVHGQVEDGGRPPYLTAEVRLVRGDIRDQDAVRAALRAARPDVVFHLAAMVGVGQSMYQIVRYTEVNALGAANLLECLVEERGAVRKVVVASSMSIYGEGAYDCPSCGAVAPRLRPRAQLEQKQWELLCPDCGRVLTPRATAEEKPLYPTSIYAINKRDHEEMVLAFGDAYAVPSVALRFFNIYGSRQALTNPYTGVAAIFSGRMLGNQRPIVFEDGGQLRDFVHVRDIVQGCLLAMDRPEADGSVVNVGSGRPVRVLDVGEILARELGWEGGFEVTGQFRAGDIRHCFADITRIRTSLGYEPTVTFEQGVAELVRWVAEQRGSALHNDASAATRELAARGLVR
ncbi:MAG: GDP-mannose 4,6-dehydratase [Chloroflexi bacterium]|nr:GDP-mannose 4,6-dehydratase [Chloroflexota bacterium]